MFVYKDKTASLQNTIFIFEYHNNVAGIDNLNFWLSIALLFEHYLSIKTVFITWRKWQNKNCHYRQT
jgi:hypothetical protein